MRHLHSVPVVAALSAALFVALPLGLVAENPDHVKQIKETRKCVGCDLRDADLMGLQAELGDLSDADLRGAKLYKANLRGANLKGAMFAGADLKGADLSHAREADLLGAETNEHTKCPGGNAGPCQ